jgi:hypothetical protein
MTAAILTNCRILHIPKCGGNWIINALRNAEVPFELAGPYHLDYDACPRSDLPTVAFVRNPLTWWQSIWRHHARFNGRDPFLLYKNGPNLGPLFAPTFTAFMDNALREMPGYCLEAFRRFARDGHIDFIGKRENLAEDLVRALETFGEKFDRGKITDYPPRHVGMKKRFKARYTPELALRVIMAEIKAIELYGYHQHCEQLLREITLKSKPSAKW